MAQRDHFLGIILCARVKYFDNCAGCTIMEEAATGAAEITSDGEAKELVRASLELGI